MGHYQHCKPSCHRIAQDFIHFAPCPPPMLKYREFRAHALSRNLTRLEVCSIARRCRPADPDVEEGCKLFPDRPPYVVIIVSAVCAVSFLSVTCFILMYVLKRRRKKTNENDTEPHGNLQYTETVDVADNLREIDHVTDVQMTENEPSKIADDNARHEEHTREKNSDSNRGNESHKCDLETELANERRQSTVHSDGKHNVILKDEGPKTNSGAEYFTLASILKLDIEAVKGDFHVLTVGCDKHNGNGKHGAVRQCEECSSENNCDSNRKDCSTVQSCDSNRDRPKRSMFTAEGEMPHGSQHSKQSDGESTPLHCTRL